MSRFNLVGLSLYFLGLLSNDDRVGRFPISCYLFECPTYDIIAIENDYEIRLYNSPEWISTAPIEDNSLVDATGTGVSKLLRYIRGENGYNQMIEITAPVITQVKPSNGSFVVSFYVPKKNQADPPPAEGLHVQKWGPTYAAVRQFSGFVEDSEVVVEAAKLKASLEGSFWAHVGAGAASEYIVAQYNPFEFEDRLNEIWMTFSLDEVEAM